MFSKSLEYESIWYCDKKSYKNYNFIKFTLMPMFILFTLIFFALNNLIEYDKDRFRKLFAKEKNIDNIYRKIKIDYIKQNLND